MNIKRQDAGRVGGLQTALRYGSEGMSARGRLGGRPPLLTIENIRQQSASEVQNKETEGVLPTGLKELKGLFAARKEQS